MLKNALYVAFEGVDGSGKSTQIELVSSTLREKGFKVLNVPFKPVASQVLRDYSIITTGDKGSMRSLFNLSCVEYVHACDQVLNFTNLVLPNLKNYDIIIQDRSKLSRIVNAKYANSPINDIENILSIIPDPDYFIYFCIEPKESFRRLNKRGNTTTDENLEFLTFASKEYSNLISETQCLIIDAKKSQIEITKDILNYFEKLIYSKYTQVKYF